MKNILVTGGGGFIGANLALKLKRLNYNVTIFDSFFRNNYYFKDLKKNNIHILKGDIRNYKSVNNSLKNIDTCFHLAAINGTKNFYTRPKEVLDVGVRGQINILDAVNNNNVKEFIFMSSSEVYQYAEKFPTDENINLNFPNTHYSRYSYGGSKFISEIMTFHYLNNNIKKIIIRPHNIYGSKMGYEHVITELISKIIKKSNNLKKKEIVLDIQGSGNESRSFCYIDDAIDGIVLCFKKGKNKNIYNVGNNEEIKIINLIKKIGKILNIKINIKKKKIKEGSCMRRYPSIKKIKNLGFSPKYSLERGLKLTIEKLL